MLIVVRQHPIPFSIPKVRHYFKSIRKLEKFAFIPWYVLVRVAFGGGRFCVKLQVTTTSPCFSHPDRIFKSLTTPLAPYFAYCTHLIAPFHSNTEHAPPLQLSYYGFQILILLSLYIKETVQYDCELC